MSLRTKLILLALVPLLVVTGIFSAVTLHQGDILMERELQIFEQNLQTSFLTPPFGFSLFYLKGVSPPEVKTTDIYRGVAPFILLLALMVSIGVVVSAGVLFNVHEHRLADQNLKELSHKTVQHQEEERRRVSRELHDGINQLLVSVKYRLETAMTHIPEGDSVAQESLVKGGEVLNRAIQEVRRISHDLRPSVLDDLGLLAALNQLLDDFRERSGIVMDIDIQPPQEDISEEVATTLYRIVQEALSNVEKHAQATRLALSLEEDAEGLFLCISDNGVGIAEKDAYARRGIGLRNMRERVEFLGGEFEVSPRPGNGTRIMASFKQYQA